jgi:hypothetical protein
LPAAQSCTAVARQSVALALFALLRICKTCSRLKKDVNLSSPLLREKPRQEPDMSETEQSDGMHPRFQSQQNPHAQQASEVVVDETATLPTAPVAVPSAPDSWGIRIQCSRPACTRTSSAAAMRNAVSRGTCLICGLRYIVCRCTKQRCTWPETFGLPRNREEEPVKGIRRPGPGQTRSSTAPATDKRKCGTLPQ